MSSWILCKDIMPDDGVVVWVTIAGSDIIVKNDGETFEQCIERQFRELRRVELAFYSKEWDDTPGWFDYSGYPMVVYPIAWMPMEKPTPYKTDVDITDDMEEFWREKDFFESDPFDE